MTSARPAVLAVVACALALCLGGGQGALAAPRAAHGGGPSQAVVAKRLVARLAKAHGQKARTRAALAIVRALHISVVTATGRPLSVAPEPGAAGRFALYDFELRGLGNALRRGPVTDLDGVAANLTKAGLALDASGRPFPPALLRTSLLGAVRQAVRRPARQRTLLPLVVRELGLRHHYDLGRKPPAALPLDPLQAWLIGADIEISVLRRLPAGGHPAAAGASIASASTAGPASLLVAPGAAATSSSLVGDCEKLTKASDDLKKRIEKAIGGKIHKSIAVQAVGMIYDKVTGVLGRKVTRWGIRNTPRWAVRGTYGTLKALNIAKPLIDALHGSLLALSVDVRAVREEVGPVHWLHGAGESGHQLTFEVKATMLDDYGEALVKCGGLAGFQMPPPGPIEGVPVAWTPAGGSAPLAPDMGTLDCGTVCVTKTGKDGIARLTFTPRSEKFPGIGMEREATGVMDGVALYQTAADSGLSAQLAQFATPKLGGIRWRVTYHKEPSLSLRMSVAYDESYANQRLGLAPFPIVDGGGNVVSTYWETAGSGAKHFALASDVPLAAIPAGQTGTAWSGLGALGWSGFAYEDLGEIQTCNDLLGPATVDERGSAPAPGRLVVDAVSKDPAVAPGITAVLHLPGLPAYTVSETTTLGADHGTCFKGTRSERRDYEWFLSALDEAEGVLGVSLAPDEHSSDTYRIGDWTPGGPPGGGADVYAYRDFPFSDVDEWGDTWPGRVRLELVAAPAP